MAAWQASSWVQVGVVEKKNTIYVTARGENRKVGLLSEGVRDSLQTDSV